MLVPGVRVRKAIMAGRVGDWPEPVKCGELNPWVIADERIASTRRSRMTISARVSCSRLFGLPEADHCARQELALASALRDQARCARVAVFSLTPGVGCCRHMSVASVLHPTGPDRTSRKDTDSCFFVEHMSLGRRILLWSGHSGVTGVFAWNTFVYLRL